MKKVTIETECPRCEALQTFVHKYKVLVEYQNAIKVFIKCRVCPYEQVLRISTFEIEELLLRTSKLRSYINYVKIHGVNPVTSQSQLREAENKLTKAQYDLKEDLNG
jgi:hypothetical protein